jgi:hypothetical protein
LRSLPFADQVAEVLELEKSEIYFSKDLSNRFLIDCGPGTRAMLASMLRSFKTRGSRAAAKHGWPDSAERLPHFTFLD